MPRKNRKPEIIKDLSSGELPLVVAAKHGVTDSYVYHLEKMRREGFKAKAEATPETKPAPRLPTGDTFEQLSISSIRRYGGDIAEEYLRELQGQYGVQMYKEMGNHPICAAVLQAVKMTLRRVQWYAVAPKSGREQEVDFVNSLMDDMSLTWSDFIDQSLSMLQFGFAPMEIVLKLRRGYEIRPGPRTVESRYKDGKVGWRKFHLVGQDTLAPGNSWKFDDKSGDLLGLNQMPPQGFIPYNIKRLPVFVPIQKLALFRTTAFKDNPEGYSLFRPMFRSYYYAINLEEVEAIAAERMGSGFPVFYLGDDISKADDGNSEINEYRKIARNLRVDEQAGLVIPHAKMGQGAREGMGVRLEFASPERGATINFTNMIERHEKRMAMVGLAQFIHLGMSNSSGGQGSALAEVTTDFFQLAVSAWADSIRDTINRSALFPLLRLNRMNIEEPVIIEHSAVGSPDLKVVADYINKTVGAKVIEPDDQLENSLRRLAGMPEKDHETTRSVMVEVNGDGGIRTDRQGKTKPGVGQPNDTQVPTNNQRNQNPKVEAPQEPDKPEARKPMRASEETKYDTELFALTKRALKFSAGKESV